MTRGTNADADARECSVGLGLYIVSEIAKAHAGGVTYVSLPDEGTTFSVVCPRRAAPPG